MCYTYPYNTNTLNTHRFIGGSPVADYPTCCEENLPLMFFNQGGRMYEKKYSPHKFPPLFCQEMAEALRMTEQKKSWDPKVLKNCGFDEVPVQPINPLLALNTLKVKQREADK